MNEKYSLKINTEESKHFTGTKFYHKKKKRKKVNRFHGSIKGGIGGSIHQKLLEGWKIKWKLKFKFNAQRIVV